MQYYLGVQFSNYKVTSTTSKKYLISRNSTAVFAPGRLEMKSQEVERR